MLNFLLSYFPTFSCRRVLAVSTSARPERSELDLSQFLLNRYQQKRSKGPSPNSHSCALIFFDVRESSCRDRRFVARDGHPGIGTLLAIDKNSRGFVTNQIILGLRFSFRTSRNWIRMSFENSCESASAQSSKNGNLGTWSMGLRIVPQYSSCLGRERVEDGDQKYRRLAPVAAARQIRAQDRARQGAIGSRCLPSGGFVIRGLEQGHKCQHWISRRSWSRG